MTYRVGVAGQRRWGWRRIGAVYIFAALWITVTVLHGVGEYLTAWARNREHGLDSSEGWRLEWFRSTMENWQSEFLQVLVSILVVEIVVSRRRWFGAGDEE